MDNLGGKMKKLIRNTGLLFAVVFSILIQSACTTSIIKTSNPNFANASDDYALVYVMRPELQRTRGIADHDLTIEFGEFQVVTLLSSGEYVAFKVKPGKLDIITRNETYLTGKPVPEKVWRARNFIFEKGKKYFIEAKFTQEEWRGIYFVPEEISEETAKSYVKRLKPAGQLAMHTPLDRI